MWRSIAGGAELHFWPPCFGKNLDEHKILRPVIREPDDPGTGERDGGLPTSYAELTRC